jgi:TonB family protein
MSKLLTVCVLASLLVGLQAEAQATTTEPPQLISPAGKTEAVKSSISAGGVEILSDTMGVDFKPYMQRLHRKTEKSWQPLIPEEVNPPRMASGEVMIRFKILPNGRVMNGSMVLEGRSGHAALDRAAWGAIVNTNYPPLPEEFKGPFLEVRLVFLYNKKPIAQDK